MEKTANEGGSLDRLDNAYGDVLDDRIAEALGGKNLSRGESAVIERSCDSLRSLLRKAEALRESVSMMGDDESYAAESALMYFKRMREQAREYGRALVRQSDAGGTDMDTQSIDALNSARSLDHERLFLSVLLCLQSLAMEPYSEKLRSFKDSLLTLLHDYGLSEKIVDEESLDHVYTHQETLARIRGAEYSPQEVEELRQSEEFRELEMVLNREGIDEAAIEGAYKALEHFALRSAILDAKKEEKYGQKTAA